MYPEPNAPGTNNGLQNNLDVPRFPKAVRDNYDGKVNWNRNSSHQFWGKFSTMHADVQDLFYLPFTEAGGGETTVSLWTVGQTWTITPDAPVRRQRRFEQDDAPVERPGLRHQLRARPRDPRHEQRRRHRPGIGRPGTL